MEFIVQAETLALWMKEKELILIDVRSNLQDPDAGEAAYKKDHLPGAYYLHPEHDLSGEVTEHGGNHPLPNMEKLAEKLGSIGVNKDKTVVIYDSTNDMFAARAWWLLTYMGHNKTFMLDGGYEGWKQSGYEMATDVPENHPANFVVNIPPEMIVSMDEVKNRKENVVLIDSRSYERYLGEKEPLYKKAGHIPGAVNYFWKDVLDDHGRWKSKEELQHHFRHLGESDEIIVSCGSGISACPNIAALREAGFKHVKLYPGSYSDWISYSENPVHKGEE